MISESQQMDGWMDGKIDDEIEEIDSPAMFISHINPLALWYYLASIKIRWA